MAAALLSFREGLEAALIVGIVLAYLGKTGLAHRQREVWAGALLAAIVSIAAALALFAAGARLEGRAEEVFEGVTMLLAAAVLTWMIFWMQRQARTMHDDIKRQVSRVNSGDRWALFSLAFLAVVREGIELALFLTAAVFAASAAETLLGALLGLAAAIALGWLVFGSARRIDVRTFFTLSSLLLLVFAAGMVGRGVHELNEAGIIPSIIEHVWSTKSILADTSSMGALLKTLFGYNDDPSLTQVIAYVGYVAVVAWAALARRRQPSPA